MDSHVFEYHAIFLISSVHKFCGFGPHRRFYFTVIVCRVMIIIISMVIVMVAVIVIASITITTTTIRQHARKGVVLTITTLMFCSVQLYYIQAVSLGGGGGGGGGQLHLPANTSLSPPLCGMSPLLYPDQSIPL